MKKNDGMKKKKVKKRMKECVRKKVMTRMKDEEDDLDLGEIIRELEEEEGR